MVLDIDTARPRMFWSSPTVTKQTWAKQALAQTSVRSADHHWSSPVIYGPGPVDQVGWRTRQGRPWRSRAVLPRMFPRMPRSFISRATWSRPTSLPVMRIAVASLSAHTG